MEISDLEKFLVLVEHLHFGRAADELHMGQPHLSREIKRLEEKLGVKLFNRSPRSVTLTPSGEALVGPAEEILLSVKKAELTVLAANKGEVGLVRIGTAGMSTYELLAMVARLTATRTPGIELKFTTQNFGHPALKSLREGSIDIAIGWFDQIPAELSAEVLREEHLVVAVPEESALGGRTIASFKDFLAEPFISLPPFSGAVLVDRLQHLSREFNTIPNIIQIAPDTQVAIAMVRAGLGCFLTLQSVAELPQNSGVHFVSLQETDTVPDVHLRAAHRRIEKNHAVPRVFSLLLEEHLAIDAEL